MEIGEMFPFEKAAFAVNIFEQAPNYCIADIWAWDSSLYEKIEKVFPFTHVIPEDLVFQSSEAGIRVFEYNGLQHLVAHDRKGFIGGTSLRSVSKSDLELFVRGLGKRAQSAYSGAAIPVIRESNKGYPWCMEYVQGKDLRKFSSGVEMVQLREGLLLAERAVLYFLATACPFLFRELIMTGPLRMSRHASMP